MTLYALQTLLNQFSNFVGCLSCNCGTDEQTLTTPEHVQPIWQGCPLTLSIKRLWQVLTRSIMIFRPGGVYTTSRGWTGISS